MSHHPERTARNVRPVNQPPSFWEAPLPGGHPAAAGLHKAKCASAHYPLIDFFSPRSKILSLRNL